MSNIFSRAANYVSSLKLSKPTQENNEFWFALYNLVNQGQIKFYDENPETYINKGYAINPHVYSVINRILIPISAVPFNVYEVVDQNRMNRAKMLKERGEFVHAKAVESLALQPLDSSKLPFDFDKFFDQPNENQSWAEFISEMVGFKLLLGNTFQYGLEPIGLQEEQGTTNNRFFSKMYNLPAQFVEIVAGDWQRPVAAYKLLLNNTITFDADKVLHQKYFNPKYSADGAYSFGSAYSALSTGTSSGSNYYGLSPMAPLCRVVKRSNDSFLASMRMLENGIPAGILSSVGKTLGDKEKKQMQRAYIEKFGGATSKNKVLFASSELKWQSLGMNSVDMQLLDSNKADLQDIARVYRVPLPLLLNEASTMDNLNTSKKSLWQDAILPELNSIRNNLNNFLVGGWERITGKKLYIDYDISNVGALQKDIKEQSDRLINELSNGIWTIGEVRHALGGDITDEEIMKQRILATNKRFIDEALPNIQINSNDGN